MPRRTCFSWWVGHQPTRQCDRRATPGAAKRGGPPQGVSPPSRLVLLEFASTSRSTEPKTTCSAPKLNRPTNSGAAHSFVNSSRSHIDVRAIAVPIATRTAPNPASPNKLTMSPVASIAERAVSAGEGRSCWRSLKHVLLTSSPLSGRRGIPALPEFRNAVGRGSENSSGSRRGPCNRTREGSCWSRVVSRTRPKTSQYGQRDSHDRHGSPDPSQPVASVGRGGPSKPSGP